MHHRRSNVPRTASGATSVSHGMTNLSGRLRAAILGLLVAALVACTPGGGTTPVPAAPGGAAPSTAPASGIPGY
jgi:hypothetical protein